LGIGTLLNNATRIPENDIKIVFGTGSGYGTQYPVLNKNWKIFCVRGPLTADSLGVSRNLAIADGGILIRRIIDNDYEKKFEYGFIPHHETADSAHPDVEKLCLESGVSYIDPNLPISEVINKICSVKILLAEAMHGAIVADALRIPWIPVICQQQVQQFKWMDWCQSINLEYRPNYLPIISKVSSYSDNCEVLPHEYFIEKFALDLRNSKKFSQYISNYNIIENLTQRLEEKANLLSCELRA
jgi:succinoglycan biosynthesis protein ExoV